MISHIIPRSPFRGYGAYNISFFLAGGITNWRDWIKDRMDGNESFFNSVIVDPNDRWYDVDLTTEWEFEALHYSDIVVFWFPKDAANVVTMFELGWICRDHLNKVVVGCDPEFKYYKNIVAELKQLRPDVTVVTSLQEVLDAMSTAADELNVNSRARRKTASSSTPYPDNPEV